MIIRRLLPLALLAILLVPATAGAAAKKQKVSKVQLKLTAGSENVIDLRQTVEGSFALPAGASAAKACKGKLKFQAAVGTKYVNKNGRRVKQTIYAKGSGALAASTRGCSASATLAMSPVLLGKTIRYTVKFKGNTVLKPFLKTAKLKVRIVSTPLTPTAGPWIMQQTGAAPGSAQQWAFTVGPDGSVGALKRLTTLKVQCFNNTSVDLTAAPTEMVPFNTPFKITMADVFARDDNDDGGAAISTSSLTAKFDSPSHATGVFQLVGNLGAPPTVYPGCDTGAIPVELKPGSFA